MRIFPVKIKLIELISKNILEIILHYGNNPVNIYPTFKQDCLNL
nr:MAG TPA: hypothetical protein [Caudoviricetes sp.]DAS08037.1 MAG TPA: hypothetical protein [Caudoviricetes sp.]